LFASGRGSGRCRRSQLCEFEQVGRPKLVANKSLSHPVGISSQTAASSLDPSEPVIPNDWTSNGLATTGFSEGNGDYMIVFQRTGIIFEQNGIETGFRAGARRGTHDTSEKLPSLWG
jgi:hypothetical protein